MYVCTYVHIHTWGIQREGPSSPSLSCTTSWPILKTIQKVGFFFVCLFCPLARIKNSDLEHYKPPFPLPYSLKSSKSRLCKNFAMIMKGLCRKKKMWKWHRCHKNHTHTVPPTSFLFEDSPQFPRKAVRIPWRPGPPRYNFPSEEGSKPMPLTCTLPPCPKSPGDSWVSSSGVQRVPD